MDFNFPKKHSAQDTNIFTVMSNLAQQHNAINLSQGFPDFAIDEKLSQLLLEASEKGFNQYAPSYGLPMLREAISKDFLERNGVKVNPDTELTITPGATYGIYTALSALLLPGDEVIVLEPAYDSYIPNIEMNGAKAISVKLNPKTFAPDWEAINAAITAKTKAIIVNTPHNPTGTIWQKTDWDELANIIRDTQIIVISDEVYEQLVYDQMQHHSVLQHAELRERSFAIYSFGKAFHNTGWKVGFCIAAPKLTTAFRKLHQFISFSTNTPAQYALANFIPQNTLNPPSILLQSKRDYFLEQMKNTPFKMLAPSLGSYFQLASFEGMSSLSDKDFAIQLTKDFGVATIPVSAFYSDGFDNQLLRFCFAKKDETIAAAAQRLANLK